ncbi:MAG: AAA family ATPase [Clostridiales bacterium]|nr:AAA family ATPase [Clostridiales bacterium]
MQLSKIRIKNYRLLIDAELDVDKKTTLIIGRNNTAKTSCMDCIDTVLKGKDFSYNDYPLTKRQNLCSKILEFMEKKIKYDELCEQMDIISVEFIVDYSLDEPDDNLGALSPFIIDVDMDTTTAIVRAEYRLKTEEKALWDLFEKSCYDINGNFSPDVQEVHSLISEKFENIFELALYAVNPKNIYDRQIKTKKEVSDLFPLYSIPAERVLGEDGTQNNSSLSSLIADFFDLGEDELSTDIVEEVKKLREVVENANKDVQKNSDKILSTLVNSAIGFGYPNSEELQLGVTTKLNIDDQIKNQTKLSYTDGINGESLPSSYNGLGYKNLIKMEFLLVAFAKEVAKRGETCIPLLFIEEPESHMHPQMQHAFAEYLESFLGKISNVHIQTFLTSHSAHIANTMDFSKIRYAQKTKTGVIYKNMNIFALENADNMDFIKKYLTLSRCDLFFADKIIFIEGASERLLMPDIIDKCDQEGLFNSVKYKLPAQYYALIEIGGAYAHKFIPFADFLGLPCLILTDIDSMLDGRTKEVVSKGKTTSNATIKWWMREVKSLPQTSRKQIELAEIIALKDEQKTRGKCHIEFQTTENGLCGRSLEEAIKNVNRKHYKLKEPVTEDNLKFEEKSKTDFALNLICDYPKYKIPQYIKNGLVWLNNQKVLE